MKRPGPGSQSRAQFSVAFLLGVLTIKRFMKDKRIAFVGIGRMGSNMARHLKDQGYTISAVSDVSAELTKTVADELGAKACSTLAEVTAASDVIVTVVSDDQAM